MIDRYFSISNRENGHPCIFIMKTFFDKWTIDHLSGDRCTWFPRIAWVGSIQWNTIRFVQWLFRKSIYQDCTAEKREREEPSLTVSSTRFDLTSDWSQLVHRCSWDWSRDNSSDIRFRDNRIRSSSRRRCRYWRSRWKHRFLNLGMLNERSWSENNSNKMTIQRASQWFYGGYPGNLIVL